MGVISDVDSKLAEFAERVPAKGTHIAYLDKARELIELYGDMLSIVDDEQSPENEKKVMEISKEIDEITKK